METLFETGGALRFHAEKTAVTCLAASEAWPPFIAAAGHARVLRAWSPDTSGQSFNPVGEMQEMDGDRFVAVAFVGSRLVAADASENGKVTVFDCSSSGGWKRAQTMLADGAVESLQAAGDYIAVGRKDGLVRVWKQLPGEATFKPLFNPDLKVDKQPIKHLHLEEVTNPDEVLLVVYATGKACVGVWRLSDGKMLHTWGATDTSSEAGGAAQGKLPCLRSTLKGGILSLVFWAHGEPAAEVHLMHILSGEGGRVPVDDRLELAAKPLCSSFDGATLAVGFEDGRVSVFGKKGWRRWHRGSVGAIQVLGSKEQVVSGGADKAVCLWGPGGCKVAQVLLEEAVTALSAGPLYAVAGTERGDVHVVVLSGEGGGSSSSEAMNDGETEPSKDQLKVYDPYFDSRWKGGGRACRASEALEEFREFVPPEASQLPDPEAISAMRLHDDAQPSESSDQQSTQQQQGGASGGEGEGSKGGEDEGSGKKAPGGSSKFDMGAALKGTERSPEEEEEGSGKEGPRNPGEDEGVARSTGKVRLESNTELVGRKCDNPTCMVREGLGGAVFKRCGACKQQVYCSVHCQRTHWRDGHSKECKTMAKSEA